MMNPPLQQMIQREAERWNDCNGVAQMHLLRLGLLREVIQILHSEKSRCLAEGNKEQAQKIRILEGKLDELRETAPLQGDLFDLLQKATVEKPKKKRLIPESLYLHLDRSKLERYDRKWECAIAAEAVTIQWKFWCLDSWVKIPQIEEWNRSLMDRLWPLGLVLFSESANTKQNEILHNTSSTDGTGDSSTALWRGNWIVILDSQIKHPSDLSLHMSHWPGSSEKTPHPTQWKLIYP